MDRRGACGFPRGACGVALSTARHLLARGLPNFRSRCFRDWRSQGDGAARGGRGLAPEWQARAGEFGERPLKSVVVPSWIWLAHGVPGETRLFRDVRLCVSSRRKRVRLVCGGRRVSRHACGRSSSSIDNVAALAVAPGTAEPPIPLPPLPDEVRVLEGHPTEFTHQRRRLAMGVGIQEVSRCAHAVGSNTRSLARGCPTVTTWRTARHDACDTTVFEVVSCKVVARVNEAQHVA